MPGLLLTEEQRAILEEFHKAVSGLQQRRAHLILLYDDGLITFQAAEQAGFSRSQARFWKHQFQLDGLAIFPGLVTSSPPSDASHQDNAQPAELPSETKQSQPDASLESDALPLPGLRKRPEILPTDSLAEAGRKTWLYQFSEMIRNEQATRLGEDIEGLHDMRVATRRMRSAFDVFAQAFKPKQLKKHLQGLRATGKRLGRVRDMDVLIEKLTAYADSLPEDQKPGLDPLLSAWGQERELGRQDLLTYLDSPEYSQFKTEFNHFVQTPGEGVKKLSTASPQPDNVYQVVPVLIYERLASVRAYDSLLPRASDTQLHALRIEFKKLRYAVEYFREVLGDEAASVIQDLKIMQDRLGDFHDAVVACELITGLLRDWEKSQLHRTLSERQNPEQIVNYLAHLHSERHRLLISMPEAWSYFIRPEFRSNLSRAVSIL